MEYIGDDCTLCASVSGGGRRVCDFCERPTWCMETNFGFGYFVREEANVCGRCQGKIARFAYDRAMGEFLRVFLRGVTSQVAGLVNFERAEEARKVGLDQYGRRALEWAQGLGFVFRALANGRGPDANQVAVAKAVQLLTGLDVVRGTQLVEKTFAEEKAKLPPVPAADPMVKGRQVAAELVRIAGPNAAQEKIAMIKIVREATSLGLKEAKDVVEEVLARKIAAPVQNGTPQPTGT